MPQLEGQINDAATTNVKPAVSIKTDVKAAKSRSASTGDHWDGG